MFTIDFLFGFGEIANRKFLVEHELLTKALQAGQKLMANVSGATGLVVNDDLDEVVYSTFRP